MANTEYHTIPPYTHAIACIWRDVGRLELKRAQKPDKLFVNHRGRSFVPECPVPLFIASCSPHLAIHVGFSPRGDPLPIICVLMLIDQPHIQPHIFSYLA